MLLFLYPEVLGRFAYFVLYLQSPVYNHLAYAEMLKCFSWTFSVVN